MKEGQNKVEEFNREAQGEVNSLLASIENQSRDLEEEAKSSGANVYIVDGVLQVDISSKTQKKSYTKEEAERAFEKIEKELDEIMI